MSLSSAQQFVTRAREDNSLQSKLSSVAQGDINAIMQIARDAGFDFTKDEYLSVAGSGWSVASDELSELELDAVAGGGGTNAAAGACYTQSGGIECNNTTSTDPLSGSTTTTGTQTYAGNRNLNKGGNN
jgi:predicted ribosomally synthesized peptide with nif11-like leader